MGTECMRRSCCGLPAAVATAHQSRLASQMDSASVPNTPRICFPHESLHSWWTFAERMKLDSLEAAIEAREAAMEARVAALEQQLAAREAALEARIAALERQQAGGQAAPEGAPGDVQQQQQPVLQASLESKHQHEVVQAACSSQAGP